MWRSIHHIVVERTGSWRTMISWAGPLHVPTFYSKSGFRQEGSSLGFASFGNVPEGSWTVIFIFLLFSLYIFQFFFFFFSKSDKFKKCSQIWCFNKIQNLNKCFPIQKHVCKFLKNIQNLENLFLLKKWSQFWIFFGFKKIQNLKKMFVFSENLHFSQLYRV